MAAATRKGLFFFFFSFPCGRQGTPRARVAFCWRRTRRVHVDRIVKKKRPRLLRLAASGIFAVAVAVAAASVGRFVEGAPCVSSCVVRLVPDG